MLGEQGLSHPLRRHWLNSGTGTCQGFIRKFFLGSIKLCETRGLESCPPEERFYVFCDGCECCPGCALQLSSYTKDMYELYAVVQNWLLALYEHFIDTCLLLRNSSRDTTAEMMKSLTRVSSSLHSPQEAPETAGRGPEESKRSGTEVRAHCRGASAPP